MVKEIQGIGEVECLIQKRFKLIRNLIVTGWFVGSIERTWGRIGC